MHVYAVGSPDAVRTHLRTQCVRLSQDDMMKIVLLEQVLAAWRHNNVVRVTWRHYDIDSTDVIDIIMCRNLINCLR